MILYINDILIPEQHIRKLPTLEDKVRQSGKLATSSVDIELDNIITREYDDRISGGIFENGFFDYSVDIFDNVIKQYLWRGLLKGITIDGKDQSIKLKCINHLGAMVDKTCVYTANSSDLTPAKHIYEILISADNCAISSDLIHYADILKAISVQGAGSCYVNVDYSLEDDKKCIGVIEELCRLGHCEIYTESGKIRLFQWEEWGGLIGQAIEEKNVIAKSYKYNYITEDIYNKYSVAYNNVATIARATGSSAASILKYGARHFLVPNDDIDSTTSSDYKILLRNSTGAAWVGDQCLLRYSEYQKEIAMNLNGAMSFLKMYQQIDINFDDFTREPVLITQIKRKKAKNTIEIKGLFINTPKEYCSRDEYQPLHVTMIDAVMKYDSIRVRWVEAEDLDHLGYYIFFTATIGEWEGETSNLGISKLNIKSPETDDDGYCYVDISRLPEGATMSFKAISYDTSFNESIGSNIVSCLYNPYFWEEQECASGFSSNFYGSCYGKGLYLICGSSGEIQTSLDKKTWTRQTPAASYNGDFMAAAYLEKDKIFLLVGTLGEIQTSPDAVTWTHRTADDSYSNTFRAITQGDKYVICGGGGEIQTSSDAVTWTHQIPAGSYNYTFCAISHNNGLYVIGGSYVTLDGLQTSLDAVTWTSQTPAGGISNTIRGIAHGNGLHVTVGEGGEIQTSADAVTWTKRTVDTDFDSAFRAIVFVDMFWVIGFYGELQVSEYGDTWKHKDCIKTQNHLCSLSCGNNAFLSAGYSTELQLCERYI